jgi:hypothetical protein
MCRTMLLAVFLACSFAAVAEDTVTGEWNYKMDTPQGEVTAAMSLKVEGGKLTGKFTFEGNRVLEITEGTVKGDTLKFTVKRNRPEGGSMTYKMTAKVEGKSMKGSSTAVEMPEGGEMAWSATRN